MFVFANDCAKAKLVDCFVRCVKLSKPATSKESYCVISNCESSSLLMLNGKLKKSFIYKNKLPQPSLMPQKLFWKKEKSIQWNFNFLSLKNLFLHSQSKKKKNNKLFIRTQDWFWNQQSPLLIGQSQSNHKNCPLKGAIAIIASRAFQAICERPKQLAHSYWTNYRSHIYKPKTSSWAISNRPCRCVFI